MYWGHRSGNRSTRIRNYERQKFNVRNNGSENSGKFSVLSGALPEDKEGTQNLKQNSAQVVFLVFRYCCSLGGLVIKSSSICCVRRKYWKIVD